MPPLTDQLSSHERYERLAQRWWWPARHKSSTSQSTRRSCQLQKVRHRKTYNITLHEQRADAQRRQRASRACGKRFSLVHSVLAASFLFCWRILECGRAQLCQRRRPASVDEKKIRYATFDANLIYSTDATMPRTSVQLMVSCNRPPLHHRDRGHACSAAASFTSFIRFENVATVFEFLLTIAQKHATVARSVYTPSRPTQYRVKQMC